MPSALFARFRRFTATQWASRNPILKDAEPGWDSTNKVLKVGDGATQWSSLTTYGTAPGAATTSTAGTVALATSAQAITGTDTTHALTPKAAADAFGIAVTSTASSATPTPVGTAQRNVFYVTALAVAATFAAPTGTVPDGAVLVIRIKDNGTARALTWNTVYRSIATLPTTTVATKTLYLTFIANLTDGKWDLISVAQQP